MLPSDPPVVSNDTWKGCQVRVEMSFSWPRRRQMSRIMRRSNIRAVWSLAHVARSWPLVGSNAVLDMVFL